MTELINKMKGSGQNNDYRFTLNPTNLINQETLRESLPKKYTYLKSCEELLFYPFFLFGATFELEIITSIDCLTPIVCSDPINTICY